MTSGKVKTSKIGQSAAKFPIAVMQGKEKGSTTKRISA